MFKVITFLMFPLGLFAQPDTVKSKLTWTGDFRFRIEQDWHSRKPDGTYSDNRTRLRYRARVGLDYSHNRWASMGMRIRTGDPNKQQDPQLTLGEGFEEFGTLPIGFEKIFFMANFKNFDFWLGKNTFPFEKSNELFWSDNVFPEGVFLQKGFRTSSGLMESLFISGGHFIVSATGSSLGRDGFFQGWQIKTSHLNSLIRFFPSIYFFRNMPNIPDGNDTFLFDYTILHVGTRISLKKPVISLEIDYYSNLENYDNADSIDNRFKNERKGLIAGISAGKLINKGDWLLKASYCYLERFAAVDFLAQNDWARWDYSNLGSPDGRLTNMKGVEIVASYTLVRNLILTVKYYNVEQIKAADNLFERETGDRIRFDLDINF